MDVRNVFVVESNTNWMLQMFQLARVTQLCMLQMFQLSRVTQLCTDTKV